jgi:molecular chaperone GrpE
MANKPVSDPADAPDRVDEGTVPGAPTEAMQSAEPVADLRRERDDYYDRWLRKTAEFDNYRKRIERERREQSDESLVRVLSDLLLVVDDFDRAIEVEADHESAAYRKGVELIHAKLHDVLRRYNVRPIEAVGADFDPNRHEAVTYEPAAGRRDGEVIGELRRGYTIGDRLLRPSMVKVAKA